MKKISIAITILLISLSSSCFENTQNSLISQDQTNNITALNNNRENGRDWSKNPSIVNIDTNQDIFAMGDVHGDYDTMVKLLKGAKIIKDIPDKPANVQWNAGKATFVCTGDMIDKWTKSLDVLTLLSSLKENAAASGGQVIITMGNHEAEFLADPNNSKATFFISELNAAGISPVDVANGKNTTGQFLRSLPFAARVGKWFFAHAANTAGKTLNQLNSDLQNGVTKDGFSSSILIDPDSLLEARLSPSPWWERAGTPEATLKSYTSNLGVEHLVMGHQPGSVQFSDGTTRSKGSPFQKFGLIFMIDVGMSQGVDSNPGVILHINSNSTKVTTIYSDGKETILWNQSSKNR